MHNTIVPRPSINDLLNLMGLSFRFGSIQNKSARVPNELRYIAWGTKSFAKFREMLVTARERAQKLKSARKTVQEVVARKNLLRTSTRSGEKRCLAGTNSRRWSIWRFETTANSSQLALAGVRQPRITLLAFHWDLDGFGELELQTGFGGKAYILFLGLGRIAAGIALSLGFGAAVNRVGYQLVRLSVNVDRS
jgi:hypothetical protein